MGCPPSLVRAQLEAVFAAFPPAAAKTGMLYSAGIVHAVAEFFVGRPRVPLIVDPVMVAGSGRALLTGRALEVLRRELLPMATLITPNVAEAELLSGRSIRSEKDQRTAARDLAGRFGCAVVVKGGHLPHRRRSVDIFWDGRIEKRLAGRFYSGLRTHGTGCVFASAVAAFLARGQPLPRSVALAKRYVTRMIGGSQRAGRHWVLGQFRPGCFRLNIR